MPVLSSLLHSTMFKFKVNKNLQLNGDNSKSQEEFFNLSKIASYGLPHKPSALAWDSFLSLMAIGTQTGGIRIYGAPGVCFSGQHKQSVQVVNLIFVPKQGRLISLCNDNSLHLWELNTVKGSTELAEVKSYTMGGLMKRITAVSLKLSSDILFIGTLCGNIYTLSVDTFELAESVIYQDVIIQNVPDQVKLNEGSVKVISEQPGNPHCLLIGYQQGLMALWDNKDLVVVSFFVASQSLESVTWHRRGDKFMTSHSDGSYVIWSTDDPSKPAEVPITPYGPFACKAISRILWKSVKGGDDYIIFNGGMQRAVHGEKSTISILCGERHKVFDLSSKVVDFFTVSDSLDESDFDNPHSLVILLEEELIVLDLESDEWLPYRLPYLDIPHSSPVTCTQFCAKIHPDVSKLLLDINQNFDRNVYSESEWPIKGGKSHQNPFLVESLLVTGHENGCIKFWSMLPNSLRLLYCFQTADNFITYDKSEESEELEEWPPFQKIGNFDSLCGDSRLAIRKLVFNDLTRTLVVGGTAGQILVFNLLEIEAEKDIKPTIVHLSGDYNAAAFSGHVPLMVRSGVKSYAKGLHLQALIQLTPPAAVTSLAYHSEWNIFAAGMSHGFLLFDIIQKKCIMSKCTLGINAETPTSPMPGEDSLARSQTLKRSLRESFRKLRKGKSLRQGRDRTGSFSSELMRDSTQEESCKRESFASSPDPTVASSPSPELRSFASESESRQGDHSLNSAVQCVYLAQSFIINNVITTPTFWAGTSNGFVYIYTLTIPTGDSRGTDTVNCQLGKEVQLRHCAPVIAIQIVDHTGYPLPDPLEVQNQRVKPADLCRSHRVIVCSEEQIKVFTLPSMKSLCKYKVTLLERCHINQVAFASFQSKSDPKSIDNCAVCLTNLNEITLFCIPDLKKRISFQYASMDCVSLTSNFVFSRDGRFIYMTSPSEFEMCSLSSSLFAQPSCLVEIPEGARERKKTESDIVLEVRNISLDLRSDERRSSVEAQANGITVASNGDSNAERSREEYPSGADLTTEINGGSNSIIQQFKRAPLAIIEELNSSEESSYERNFYVLRSSCST